MPTTRNRWQIETKTTEKPKSVSNDSSDEADLLLVTENSPKSPEHKINSGKASSETGNENDINPRSPKRRRLSSSVVEDIPTTNLQEPQSVEAAKEEVSKPDVEAVSVVPGPATGSAASEARVVQDAGHHVANPPPSLPSQQTRLDNLAILSNLSSQLLSILAKMSPAEALQLTRPQSSQNAREYHFIRSLFNPVRDLYLTNSPFLLSTVLGLDKPEQVEILGKANQAMYMSSIFTGEIGLRDMDQNFLEVFVPEQGRLLKAQGAIYLELKTQAFMTAHRTGAAQPLMVMGELFPHDMESKLLDRRPGVAKSMAPSELDFLSRLSSRREILLADVKNNTLNQLYVRYRWEDLSREVSSYLSKNFGPPAQVQPSSTETFKQETPPALGLHRQSQMQGEFSIHEPPLPFVSPPGSVGMPGFGHGGSSTTADNDEFVAQAARAADIAMRLTAPSYEPMAPTMATIADTPASPKAEPHFQHYTPASVTGDPPKPLLKQDEIPHISQSAPTHVLYEQARQATNAKATVSNKKPASPSQRRPWTPEEEAALMIGLDQVKGPHWSQILAMYGPGGTIDESLKDRNQVQLKDKARNLKLFFLKAGIEVPYYLSTVTGDLKTRAPGQMEKHEARERGDMDEEGHDAESDGAAHPLNDTEDIGEYGSPSISPIDEDEILEELTERVPSPQGDDDVKTTAQAGVEAMIARAAAEASEGIDPS